MLDDLIRRLTRAATPVCLMVSLAVGEDGDRVDPRIAARAMNGTAPTLASGPGCARQQSEYEIAQGVLDRDAEILDQMRSRANILLAALAIGVTALGAILAGSAHTRIPIWLQALLMGFLVAAILCCVGVLWSVRDHGRFTSSRLREVIDACDKEVKRSGGDNVPIPAAATKTQEPTKDPAQAYAEAVAVVESLKRVSGPDAGKTSAASAASAKKELRRAKVRAASARRQLDRTQAEARYREYKTLVRAHAEAQDGIYAAAQAHAEAQAGVDAAWRAHIEADALARADAIAAALQRASSAREELTKALAKAAGLERIDGLRHLRQRATGSRAARAWRHFRRPWREWRLALGHDQRLWKTKLTRKDMRRIPSDAWQVDVDQVLLEFLYLAHDRNNGTLSRRADLLRFASLFVAAFVITLGAWLPSHV